MSYASLDAEFADILALKGWGKNWTQKRRVAWSRAAAAWGLEVPKKYRRMNATEFASIVALESARDAELAGCPAHYMRLSGMEILSIPMPALEPAPPPVIPAVRAPKDAGAQILKFSNSHTVRMGLATRKGWAPNV